MNKKILMTSDTFLPVMGGGEIHVKNIIEQLESRGFEVPLITTEGRPSDFDSQHRVTRIPWKRTNLLRLFLTTWKESRGAIAIHSHYSYRLAVIGGIVGKLRGIPVFVILHGLGTLDEAGAKGIYRLAHASYRRTSLFLATHIISTSEDIAKAAEPYTHKEKITVIMNGYDDTLFNEHVSVPAELQQKYAGKKIVLTVRRLVPKNGIHYMVEAIPHLIKLLPNIHYIMIGDGRMRSEIERRIHALHIEEYVDILGVIENEHVPPYLKLADTVVFPSTAESSSIACAEAMAIGKPIVASDVGGLPELVGRDGSRGSLVKLVDWTDSNYDAPMDLPMERYESLASTIAETIHNKTTEQEHRIARYAQEHLSWSVIASKTLTVYARFIPNIAQ